MTDATTRMSTKGQVILPKSIRDRRGWGAGVRLVVEETAEGVLLKPAPAFAKGAPGAAYGVLRRGGPPLPLDAMDAAVLAEARRRARD